jgi:hypothetical protein
MRLARQHAHWLALRPEADTRPRLGRVMHIEERFRALAERVVSRDSLRAIIEAKGPDWVMLELETLAFSSEHGAREAVLCVREDGLSLYDVAALSHQPLQRAGVLVEEVPEAHRSRLLSAQLGQVQGPLSVGDRFEVSMVVTRTAATLENGRAVERARLQAVDDLTRRASREHVRRHRES